MRKTIIKISIGTLVFALVFFGLQRLLVPKYASGALEGGITREYYRSSFDHDIIFIGDCEVYANFSPVTLWEEFGVTSFVRGSPQQLIWQSYYLLQDTLRFETPEIVVFNVLAMQYNEPQNEAYNRLVLDGMRWSIPKIRAVSASMTDEEDWLSYIFPIFRFKDRWSEINAEDFRYFFRNPRVSANGFMIRSDVQAAGWFPAPVPRGNYQFGEKAWYYLDRMVQLTRENGIELVLVKAPSLFPHWHNAWNEQIVDFADKNGLLYINFLEHIDEIGLDFNYHTFNAGLHLNVFGAQLLSQFFGNILMEHFGLESRHNNVDVAAFWNDLAELQNRNIARQQAEIEAYGRIQNFLIE